MNLAIDPGVLKATALLEGIFKVKPIMGFAAANARKMMVKRGESIGYSWSDEVDALKRAKEQLDAEYERLLDADLHSNYPSYYCVPFHAYDEGNLSWQAAMEAEPAAVTVHSPLYGDNPSDLRPDGDRMLRHRFHQEMVVMLKERGGMTPERIVDIGCSTGLSTMKLHETFPTAKITGVDLSPYMCAVGAYKLQQRGSPDALAHIEYRHAAGEATGLADGSVDLVTICLVHHELPTHAAKDIFREAYRLLKPGGSLAVMDVNPVSPTFVKLATNPLFFAAFRSTEPYITEYIQMDIAHEMQEAGFCDVESRENSPRHRTVVATK